MRKRLVVLLTGILVLVSANAGLAQQRDYWVQLETHKDLKTALAKAKQFSVVARNLYGIRTEDGKFVLAIGRFGFDEARRIRISLANDGAIPATSRVNGQISVQGYFWTPADGSRFSGSASAAAENIQQPVAEFDQGEKFAIQTALKWFNEYTGEIDGIFGGGSKRAIASYQEKNGFIPTGQLTRPQAVQLLTSYNTETAEVRLEVLEDEATGISIAIPQALVRFSGYNSPFAQFESISEHEMRVNLLSMEGNSDLLDALQDLFLNSDFLPGQKEHRSGRRQFSIRGTDGLIASRVHAQLNGNRLKGFVVSWSTEHDELAQRILDAMQQSFRESHEGTLDIELTDAASEFSFDIFETLPRPKIKESASGFYIDNSGHVATTASAVSNCDAVQVGAREPMTILALDAELGLAILAPVNNLRPIAHAQPGDARNSKGRSVSVSGYSYDGELGFPTLTRGTWIGPDVVSGNSNLFMIEAPVLPGDAGGPVFDEAGIVMGMLKPSVGGNRVVPKEVNHLVAAPAVWRLAGIEPTAESVVAELDSVDLARHARDITVLVKCFVGN